MTVFKTYLLLQLFIVTAISPSVVSVVMVGGEVSAFVDLDEVCNIMFSLRL
jgi:hypothetical protein